MYHRGMPREDSLSSRFDYLFEPLDDEVSADATVDTAPPASRSSDEATQSPSRTPLRMAFAAFVIATLGAAAGVAILLAQRSNMPTGPVESPTEPAQLSSTMPDGPPHATVPPSPTTTSEAPAQAPRAIESNPQQQTAPQPTPTQRVPETHVTVSPTTRASLSVAPQTRTPFPNEGGRGGGGPQQGGGGVVGGLLGGGLPGPL
jgi:hypothetical protein